MALHCTLRLSLAGSPFGVGPSVIFAGRCFATLFFIIVVALCDALEKKLFFSSCLCCCCCCLPASAIHAQPDLMETEIRSFALNCLAIHMSVALLFAPPWRCRYRPLLPALLFIAVSVQC